MRVALVLGLTVAAAMHAHTTPAQTGASRLVLATATDPRNRPLVDLGPDDFVIEESGQSREVLSVHSADYPIVVLLGTGVGTPADFAVVRLAAVRFIERLGDDRPIAVVTFGEQPRLVASFEEDRRAVLAHVDELTADATAGRVLRGTSLAARMLRATQSLFSAVVVISGTPVEAGSDEDALGPIVEGGTTLHAVTNRGSSDSPGRDALRTFVDQTNGVYTPVYATASLQPALERLADRLTTELIVEYIVPVGSHASDVKVGVRIPGARVRGLGVAPR